MDDRQLKWVLENNPVDSSVKLGVEHLAFVRGAMISMRHCWYDIGVEFEVDTDFLDYIKGTHQNDGDACLTDTIAEWLKNGKHPNLRAIVVAIASKSGGCNPAEAEKVAKQFRESDGTIFPNVVPEVDGVDDRKLEKNEANQKEIVQALTPVAHMWKKIGIFLGLDYNTLQTFDREDQPLQTIVKKWLKKKYDVEKFGHPSWKKLVEAIGSKAGANDSAHALAVAKLHKAPVAADETPKMAAAGNPMGDIDNTRLSDNHHADLYEALFNHASDWVNIGTFLGFQQGEIKNIQGSPMHLSGAPGSWLGAMLSAWYQWVPGDGRGSKEYATLGALKRALRKAGLGVTAEELHQKLQL